MFAYRLTHNLADMTTNVSRQACDSFERFGAVPKGGIFNVYNGIDLKNLITQNRLVLTLENY